MIANEVHPCGVAVNPATKTIYWATFGSVQTDPHVAGTIRAVKLNPDGSPILPAATLFSEGDAGPSGVAIDPSAGKIYWTNQVSGAVRYGNLDGTGAAQDFSTGIVEANPIGVALDVSAGTIYWTNLASNAIRRAPIADPTAAESIHYPTHPGTPDGAVNGPFGIAIDTVGGRFYWANVNAGTIWSASVDGSSPPAQLGILPDGSNPPYGLSPNFPVILRAPSGMAPPVISGDVGVGLDCSTGTWAPDDLAAFLYRSPHGFAYQWKRNGGDITGATESHYAVSQSGSYTCRVTAANHAGEGAPQTSAALTIGINVPLRKYYDADADGTWDPTESAISGWKMQVDGVATYLTPSTVFLDPGSHVVRELAPSQSNWLATAGTSRTVSEDGPVEFGNLCIGAGGAQDTGFWKKKAGAAIFDKPAGDLAAMVGLNLRTETGGPFDPANYTSFANWIGKASSTNMAYSLSAQLAAMTLNVRHGMVSGGRLIQAPGTTSANSKGFATVSALLTEANAELGLHGLTKSSPFRAYQTALQDALSRANTNKNFVQTTACAFTFR